MSFGLTHGRLPVQYSGLDLVGVPIGLGAVREHVFIADRVGVLEVPALVAQLRIDPDAREGLVGHGTHAAEAMFILIGRRTLLGCFM